MRRPGRDTHSDSGLPLSALRKRQLGLGDRGEGRGDRHSSALTRPGSIMGHIRRVWRDEAIITGLAAVGALFGPLGLLHR